MGWMYCNLLQPMKRLPNLLLKLSKCALHAPEAGCAHEQAHQSTPYMPLQHTHIAALRSFAEGGRAEAGRGGGPPVRLHLLDTPGPNEAGEAGLRYQVGTKGKERVA
eukprot:396142-Pelagomonas_calceolata.AAC.4